MSETILECQGLPCPQPVLQCKNLIETEKPDSFSIIVDNQAAKENVTRFLGMQGYDVKQEQSESNFLLVAHQKAHSEECKECSVMDSAELSNLDSQKVLIFIASDVIGTGDDALGEKLMYNFLLTLKEMGNELWRVVMVNGGVRLSTPDNPSMQVLKDLEASGVSILVCGTCLEHFNLTDTYKVGEMTNMLDIVTSFQLASKAIRV